MAFFRKAGNILRQTVSSQIKREISASNPSIFQAIRCMSSSKVFVGGIAWSMDEQALRESFSKYGDVVEARVIVDQQTGRSRGFGFVTYNSPEDASSAIQALDGQDLYGRIVKVNFANERPPRTGGYYNGGFNNNSGGYGGNSGGYGGNPGGYGGSPGGYGGSPGGYGGSPGGYGGSPGGYGGSPGGYGGSPGGYGDNPGGYNSNPGGYNSNPGGYNSGPSDNISGGQGVFDDAAGQFNNEESIDYEKRA